MRIEGWEKRLAEYIEAAKETPFSWGQNDCLLGVARWVEECTGQDYYSEWIGQYGSQAEAQAILQSRGFASTADAVDAYLQVKPVMLAQRGDIVLHPTGALGICIGRRSHFIGEEGAFTENTLECIRAWKVG